MRPIIIEGMDATGKSTLARYLADELGYIVKESEGPIYSPEELTDRLQRYDELSRRHGGGVIFVRHPLISEPIYATHVHKREPFHTFGQSEYKLKLMVPKPIIVVCKPSGKKVDHQLKIFDTPEYLDALDEARVYVEQEYEEWVYIGLGAIPYRIGGETRYIKLCVENMNHVL